MFGNHLSLKSFLKYLLCAILLITQVDAVAEELDIQYETIENNQLVGRLWLPDTNKLSPAILLLGGRGVR